MNKPHKHAALIKQWADNPSLEIQCRLAEGTWVDCCNYFNWNTTLEYRIKPQPHKWQKEIDAYKAGKRCQWRATSPMAPPVCRQWQDMTPNSNNWAWGLSYEYRIKPEPVVLFTEANYVVEGGSLTFYRIQGLGNLKLTFEDGKLVAAEVV
jgi:hypothetical protein